MERKGIVVVIRNSFVPLWSFLVLRMCESGQIMWWGQHICLALVLNVCQDFIPYLNFSSFAFNGAGKSLKWGKSLISLELTPHLSVNSFEILSLFSTTFLYVNSYKMQKKGVLLTFLCKHPLLLSSFFKSLSFVLLVGKWWLMSGNQQHWCSPKVGHHTCQTFLKCTP